MTTLFEINTFYLYIRQENNGNNCLLDFVFLMMYLWKKSNRLFRVLFENKSLI